MNYYYSSKPLKPPSSYKDPAHACRKPPMDIHGRISPAQQYHLATSFVSQAVCSYQCMYPMYVPHPEPRLPNRQPYPSYSSKRVFGSKQGAADDDDADAPVSRISETRTTYACPHVDHHRQQTRIVGERGGAEGKKERGKGYGTRNATWHTSSYIQVPPGSFSSGEPHRAVRSQPASPRIFVLCVR